MKTRILLLLTTFITAGLSHAQVKASLISMQYERMTLFVNNLSAFELNGKVKSMTQKESYGSTLTVNFNEAGQVTSHNTETSWSKTNCTNYQYAEDGRLVNYDVIEDGNTYKITYVYDEKNRIKLIRDTRINISHPKAEPFPKDTYHSFKWLNDSVFLCTDHPMKYQCGEQCPYSYYLCDGTFVCTRWELNKNISELGECAIYLGKHTLAPQRIKEIVGGTDGTAHEQNTRPTYNEQLLITHCETIEEGYEDPAEGYIPRTVNTYQVTYTYDDQGNWTKAVIRENNKHFNTLTRIITYY